MTHIAISIGSDFPSRRDSRHDSFQMSGFASVARLRHQPPRATLRISARLVYQSRASGLPE